MRNPIILLSFVLLIFCISGCDSIGQKPKTYFNLTGFIGDFPITMHLHKHENKYVGVYWYNSQGKPISFSGQNVNGFDSLTLQNYMDDGTEERLTLKMENDLFSGYWFSDKKNKKLPVVLKPQIGVLDFDYYRTDSTYRHNADPERLTCEYSAAIIWPKTNDEFSKSFTDSLISSFGQSGKKFDSPEEFLKEAQNQYINEYRLLIDSMNNDIEFATSYSSSTNNYVLYQDKSFFCTKTDFYTYTGGAHGFGGEFYVVFDILRNKVVNIEDILTTKGMSSLPRMIQRQILKDRGVSAYEPITNAGLFEEGVTEVSKNFYITSKGIGFYYNQYEIGPYAAGPFSVFLNYKSISDYLEPNFRTVMQ